MPLKNLAPLYTPPLTIGIAIRAERSPYPAWITLLMALHPTGSLCPVGISCWLLALVAGLVALAGMYYFDPNVQVHDSPSPG